MATGKALDGKPYAGNPHVRFDEGEVAPAATPRRGSLLYKLKTCFVIAAAIAAAQCAQGSVSERKLFASPNGSVAANVGPDATGALSWCVTLDGKSMMEESRLGINVDGTELGGNVRIGKAESCRIREKYEFNGNHRTAVNDCIEYTVPVISRTDGAEQMKLAVRVFDDGAAVRYILPGAGARRIDSEATEWTAPKGSKVWYQPNTYCYEDEFDSKAADNLDTGRVVALPVTVKIPGVGYALYTEANLVNYTDLAVTCGSGGRFSAAFAANEDKNGFEQSGEGVTPWRVVIAARDLNSFFNSDVVKNLCPPADGRAKGIAKPGRSVWHWLPDDAPKFADQKGWIDRTAELGYEYYLVDMDWRDWKDSGRSSLECLKEVVDYAREKGVKIVVWRHSNDIFERDARRRFFGEMKSLGVVGVKPDFPADTGIKWVNWYEDTLRDAAEFGLMVDFHGAIKPTGRERTWPNEIAREAIRGHEWHITRYNRVLPARHDCILPFNRLIQGHADYTPIVLNERELVGYTRVHELAQGVVFSAPFFCTGDYPQNYLDSPAVDFIKALPAVYDETRVLEPTEIGEVVVFAKRSGSRWFVGVENGEKERAFDLKLDFLGKDRWKLVSYSDSEKGPTELTREERTVTSADTLSVKCAARGGFAALLERL